MRHWAPACPQGRSAVHVGWRQYPAQRADISQLIQGGHHLYHLGRACRTLSRHALIGFDEETAFVRAARKAFPFWRRDAFSIRTDSDIAQLAMIRAGSGIGICQVAIARRDPQLVHLLQHEFAMGLETWLTMHEDLRNSPHCKATFDALLRGLQAYVAG